MSSVEAQNIIHTKSDFPEGTKRDPSVDREPSGKRNQPGKHTPSGEHSPSSECEPSGVHIPSRERKASGKHTSSGPRQSSGEHTPSGERQPLGQLTSSGELQTSDEHASSGQYQSSGENTTSGEGKPSGNRTPSGERQPSGEQNPSGECQPSGEQNPSGECQPSGEHTPSGQRTLARQALAQSPPSIDKPVRSEQASLPARKYDPLAKISGDSVEIDRTLQDLLIALEEGRPISYGIAEPPTGKTTLETSSSWVSSWWFWALVLATVTLLSWAAFYFWNAYEHAAAYHEAIQQLISGWAPSPQQMQEALEQITPLDLEQMLEADAPLIVDAFAETDWTPKAVNGARQAVEQLGPVVAGFLEDSGVLSAVRVIAEQIEERVPGLAALFEAERATSFVQKQIEDPLLRNIVKYFCIFGIVICFIVMKFLATRSSRSNPVKEYCYSNGIKY